MCLTDLKKMNGFLMRLPVRHLGLGPGLVLALLAVVPDVDEKPRTLVRVADVKCPQAWLRATVARVLVLEKADVGSCARSNQI